MIWTLPVSRTTVWLQSCCLVLRILTLFTWRILLELMAVFSVVMISLSRWRKGWKLFTYGNETIPVAHRSTLSTGEALYLLDCRSIVKSKWLWGRKEGPNGNLRMSEDTCYLRKEKVGYDEHSDADEPSEKWCQVMCCLPLLLERSLSILTMPAVVKWAFKRKRGRITTTTTKKSKKAKGEEVQDAAGAAGLPSFAKRLLLDGSRSLTGS